MSRPLLYRKRIIPEECIPLKDDEILYCDEHCIITKWKTLRPKEEFDHGVSCYYLDKGFKVSKFYKKSGELLYYYCDIISFEHDEEKNSFVFTDLLADVIIYSDGRVEVVDVGEIADALENGTLKQQEMIPALRSLDLLLGIIYSGNFGELTKPIEDLE